MLYQHMPFSHIHKLVPPRPWLRRHSHDEDEEYQAQILYNREYIVLYLQIYFAHVDILKIKKKDCHLCSRAINGYITTKSNASKRALFNAYTNKHVNRIIMEYVDDVTRSNYLHSM